MRLLRLIVLAGLILAIAKWRRMNKPEPEPVRPETKVKPLPCPNREEVRAIETIGPEGGTLRLERHHLVVPPGAVRQQVEFSATLLIGDILRLDLRADGRESYAFERPATLRLSYARCPTHETRLRIYRIDLKSGRILQGLESKVNPQELWVDAELESLTGYTIGTLSEPEEPLPEPPPPPTQ
jgi:hypothetical protein